MQKGPEGRLADWAELDIESLMTLTASGRDSFVGDKNEDNGAGRVFGGQILGQALAAAASTVASDRPAHSLQLMFTNAGDPSCRMRYEVERVSDGGRTSVRSVRAEQRGKPICLAIASFRTAGSAFEHDERVGDIVAEPHELPTISSVVENWGQLVPGHPYEFIARKASVEVRPVDVVQPSATQEPLPPGGRVYYWVRTPRSLPEDPMLHLCAVAYLTDYVLAHTPALQVMSVLEAGRLQVASVNHTLWFYRPCRADEWLLLEASCPVAGSGRGLAIGKVYDGQRQVVAVTTQECVYRTPIT